MDKSTKDIVKEFNIKMTKSLGQNFLIDDNVVRKITDIADITEKDMVLEIGPGIGSMTKEICKRAGRVVAIEIDKHLMPALNENLKRYTNLKIINSDILKLDIKDIFSESKNFNIKAVANLPYYITTPIIMKLLEEELGISEMIFMMQKEVADRIVAKPGGKDYGALSVAVQFYSEPKILFNVSPNCFIPKPNVDSTIIKLKINEKPKVTVKDRQLFFKIVKASFGQRRKTLANALFNSGNFNIEKEKIAEMLDKVGIDMNRRGETLTIMQFGELADAFFEVLK